MYISKHGEQVAASMRLAGPEAPPIIIIIIITIIISSSSSIPIMITLYCYGYHYDC